jgi:hypothetical protein
MGDDMLNIKQYTNSVSVAEGDKIVDIFKMKTHVFVVFKSSLQDHEKDFPPCAYEISDGQKSIGIKLSKKGAERLHIALSRYLAVCDDLQATDDDEKDA